MPARSDMEASGTRKSASDAGWLAAENEVEQIRKGSRGRWKRVAAAEDP